MRRHSTDREVAIMILMAYLSYMLSMVGADEYNKFKLNNSFNLKYLRRNQLSFDIGTIFIYVRLFAALVPLFSSLQILCCISAAGSEWHSNRVLLWNSNVTLHLA